jgi:hypothetical protein
LFGSRLQSIAFQAGAFLSLSAAHAQAETVDGGPDLQPLTGWLIGVLIVLVFSLLTRHRPSKFGGQQQAKPGNGEY